MRNADIEPVTIDADRCNGCARCVDACPVNVLRMEGAKAVVAVGSDCHVCFLCTDDCPTGAIRVSHLAPNPRRHSDYDALDPGTLVLGVEV